MRTRVSLVVSAFALMALIVALPPLAYSSPPDPTWIAGVWDDDDFDNVVDCITSATSLAQAPIELNPVPVLVVVTLSAVDAAIAVVPLCSSGPRAPPTV